ncbi:MAG: hypothetical protein LT070_07740 [Solirubrobacteraceae bacterium]|nr:hypothetical protein [Solirubrobacteraceae bacterium]
MALDRARTLRGALAGALATGAWAAVQPLDKRLLRSEYDDVEMLGKLVTRGPGWPVAGNAMHLANGAAFGALYAGAAPRMPLPTWARGPAVALMELAATWPLAALVDRIHPARGELPRLWGSRTAFMQATFRHLLFGIVLGEVERRLNPPRDEALPSYEHIVSQNGHGDIAHAAGMSAAGS